VFQAPRYRVWLAICTYWYVKYLETVTCQFLCLAGWSPIPDICSCEVFKILVIGEVTDWMGGTITDNISIL
jgi:hypothetical protein